MSSRFTTLRGRQQQSAAIKPLGALQPLARTRHRSAA